MMKKIAFTEQLRSFISIMMSLLLHLYCFLTQIHKILLFWEKNQISNFFNLFLFRCTFTKWNLWINTQIPIFNYFSSVFLFMMIRIIPISYPCLSKHMLTKLYIIVWSNKKHTKICIGIFTSSFMIKVIFVFFYKK